MIRAFALEPRLVATWGRREEFRFIHDKFGFGTPRVMLELPTFSKWRRAVYDAASDLALSPGDMKRIEELFRLFAEHKCRRPDSVYDGLLKWLQNAEGEYDRKPFAAILATENPRTHRAVLLPDQVGRTDTTWSCPTGATPARTPEALAKALCDMLVNCKALHLVDPHFGPDRTDHRTVLAALMNLLSEHRVVPEVIRVHCLGEGQGKPSLSFFQHEAAKMADRLPQGTRIEFARWKQRSGGEKLHNRYVLTDLGGVALGTGLDAGQAGETDDLLLLSRDLYEKRWSQYVENPAFDRVDSPPAIIGTYAPKQTKRR